MIKYEQFTRLIERQKDAMKIAGVIKTKVAPGKGLFGFLKARKINTFKDFWKWVDANYRLQHVGSGAFSAAYIGSEGREIPTNFPKQFVLKVSNKGKGNADSYPRFARLAEQEWKRNPLYPRILATTTIPRGPEDGEATEDVHITIIEYVITKDENSNMWDTMSGCEFAIKRFVRSLEFDDPKESFNEIFRPNGKYYEHYTKTYPGKLEKIFANLDYNHLINYIDKVKHLGSLDLHGGNMGLRPGTSQIVIFDPVSWKAANGDS